MKGEKEEGKLCQFNGKWWGAVKFKTKNKTKQKMIQIPNGKQNEWVERRDKIESIT